MGTGLRNLGILVSKWSVWSSKVSYGLVVRYGLVWPSCNDQLHHKLYFWVYPKAIDQGWGGQPCHTAKGEQKFQFTYFNWSWAEFGKFDIFNIDWLILFSVCNSVILFSRLFLIENFEQSVFLISCINSNRTEFDKLGPSWVQLNLGCDQTKECGYFVNTIELVWNERD